MQAQRSQSPRRGPRRARVPLSCEQCRTRKLKCNRQQPCQNCTARNEQVSCKFRGQASDTGRPGPASDGLRQRIDHLEDLVKNLIKERQHVSSPVNRGVPTPESSEPEADPALPGEAARVHNVPGAGKTVMDGIHSVYLGGDDWHVVLEEIEDLKRACSQEEDDNRSSHSLFPALSYAADGSSLLFHQVKPMEKMEILSSLPPKSEVDRLISYFFDDPTFPIRVPSILHKPTFMREYAAHWENPSQTDIIWLGLLFSILNVTMLAYHQHGEPPAYEGISESLFQLYRVRTSQCLLSGDIAKCRPYTVETLRFNATAELNRADDNRRGLWIMSAVVVRAAINMGYHRDPAHMRPRVPARQAEFRRRVWLSVTCMDDMASFLGGFPRMVPAAHADTAEPRNLHDWELDALSEDDVLPPSRPLTEPTAARYLIVKGRLYRALGRVADFNSAPTLGSREELAEIDRCLQEAYDELPPYVKNFPLTTTTTHRPIPGHSLAHGPVPSPQTTTISPTTTTTTTPTPAPPRDLSAFGLLGMYHSGVCTLHRKFLARAHTTTINTTTTTTTTTATTTTATTKQPQLYAFARDRCLASALALLDMQSLLQPGFYKLWQTRQMMMLAAMVLLLEMELRRRVVVMGGGEDGVDGGGAGGGGDGGKEMVGEAVGSEVLLQALERACGLWEEARGTCEEAGRGYQLLAGMLKGLRAGDQGAGGPLAVSMDPAGEGSTPRLEGQGWEFSFDKDMTGVDFDWGTWDAFMDGTEADLDTGPLY